MNPTSPRLLDPCAQVKAETIRGKAFPARKSADIPLVNTGQMIEVDRLMVEHYGIRLAQMMENAGRALALVARDVFLGGDPRGRRVLVLAGRGGNGGGGLVAARRLHAWGADVRVILTRPDADYAGVPGRQLGILRQMRLPVTIADSVPRAEMSDPLETPALQPPAPFALPQADLVLDALIGYSLHGAPRGASAALIRAANELPAPVLALDVPSGLDATTGERHEPSIHAAATLTLALPKTGLRARAAADAVGDLYLADISVPPSLYAQPSLALSVPPLFARGDVLRLEG